MRNLVHYSSNIDIFESCIDMGRLIACEYVKLKRVLNRWVDYLHFEKRRVIYDTMFMPEEHALEKLTAVKDFPRYVSLNTLSDIMRYEFVREIGKYIDNSVFCVFVYKDGNRYEICGWNTTNALLGCPSRDFFHSTTRDLVWRGVWSFMEQPEFEKWVQLQFTS
jgi:hypothetical protein